MSNKRRRSSFLLADEEPDLHILVADAPDPLSAHSGVLRLFSVCVRDLPRADAGPTPWDLRRLVLEGEAAPVAAGVVRQWLDLIYCHVDSARQLQRFRSLDDAKPLLLFADAAGTCDAAILELCDMLVNNAAGLRLEVPLRRGAAAAAAPPLLSIVEIRLKGRLYRSNAAEGLVYIGMDAPDQSAKEVAVASQLFAPRRGEFAAALRSQLESWLYLAGRLRMVPLVRVLLDFVKTQLLCGLDAVLGPAAGDVFSARVLECMPRELLFESFMRDALRYRPNELQLRVGAAAGGGGEELAARLLTPEAVAVARLEAELPPGASAVAYGLRQSVNRSRLVMGTQAGKSGRTVAINVSVGGFNVARCEEAVRAAVARVMGGDGDSGGGEEQR